MTFNKYNQEYREGILNRMFNSDEKKGGKFDMSAWIRSKGKNATVEEEKTHNINESMNAWIRASLQRDSKDPDEEEGKPETMNDVIRSVWDGNRKKIKKTGDEK